MIEYFALMQDVEGDIDDRLRDYDPTAQDRDVLPREEPKVQHYPLFTSLVGVHEVVWDDGTFPPGINLLPWWVPTLHT